MATGGEASEKARRAAHDQLEQQVAERTAALRRANAALEAEVAERKLAVQALAVARAEALNDKNRLEAVLEALPVGVAILDAQGGVVRCNAMFAQVWSGPRPETRAVDDYAAYKAWWVDTGRPVQPEEWAAARAVRLGETVLGQLIRIQRFDGSRASVSNSAVPILDAAGKIVGSAVTIMDVSERLAAEQALRESEARLRLFIENAPAAIAMFDNDLRYLAVSHRWLIDYALVGQEVMGKSHYEVFPEIPDRWKAVHQRVLAGEVVRAEKDRFERLDGTVQWLRWEVRPWYEDTGAVGGIIMFTEEITERVVAEQALRESEERWRTLTALSPEGVFVTDARGDCLYVNERWCEMAGMSPRQAAGRSWIAALHPEDRERVAAQWYQAAAAGGKFALEYRFQTPEGRVTWLFGHSVALRDEHGGLAGYMGTISDITERKRAEQERERLLREVQRRAAELRATFDSMVDGVVAFNAEGVTVLANGLARDLLGLVGPDEAPIAVADISQRARLRHLDGSPILPDETASARALAGETVKLLDQIGHNWRTGRDVYLRTSGAPIRDEQGQIAGAVVVTRDVTELMELDRLKDQFILVAAHELKTPVAIMKGYAQALLRLAEETSPRRRKMLESVDRGADRIDDVVNDLLDIARLQEGRLELDLERIDLVEMVEEVTDRLALAAPRHQIRLRGAQPAIVQGDRARLEQVLANLLDNAIRYSPAGGEIEIAVGVRDGEAVVSVCDHGVGIPAAKQGRIFQRFYRAHTNTPHDYGGMGVGLYISKEIVERHGGKLWFDSTEGKGSTFSFCLPLVRRVTSDEG